VASAGDTIVVRAGHYVLSAQVRVHNSGRPHAWISFAGIPGENVVLDANKINGPSEGALNNGALQIEHVSYIRISNLTVINSHDAGITVRDSSDIELINNKTDGSFSSGIAVWDTSHDDRNTWRIRVIGNTISHANTWELAPSDYRRRGEPPHEALSIGGAIDFEVAYNHVVSNDKEGIVIKETSKHGRVHHNLVEQLNRQGIYVGSNFGAVEDIDIYSNVVHNCKGAGFALSVEDGQPVEGVNFHNNLLFDNDGSGIYFSRWGAENIRRKIIIADNIIYHNGIGRPAAGQSYYWQPGGIYLYSRKVFDVSIERNILSENHGFQIGFSELFLKTVRTWQAVERRQKINIRRNLLFSHEAFRPSIEGGGSSTDQVKIYAVSGDKPIIRDPQFEDPAKMDFRLRPNSPAREMSNLVGPLPEKGYSPAWWKRNFPPSFAPKT
jgi:parallel beta-helix repeat protein